MVSHVNHVSLTGEPMDFQAVCVDTLKSGGLAKTFLHLGSVDRWQCHGSLPNRLQWQACKRSDTWLWTASDFAVLRRAAFVSCAGHETCCMASKSASSSFRIVQGRTCRASASAGPSMATVKALVLLALAVAGWLRHWIDICASCSALLMNMVWQLWSRIRHHPSSL